MLQEGRRTPNASGKFPIFILSVDQILDCTTGQVSIIVDVVYVL
jgi:hypothetical protein